jgi:acyl-homoserine-lactone acylase
LNPSSGYVYNTNNTPYSASAPLDNPPLRKSQQTMSFQLPDMENSRSLRFQELIASYDKLSYEDFKRIKFDQQYGERIQRREIMNLNLLFDLAPAERPDISAEIQQLKDWNRSCDVDNQTAALFICTIQYLIQDLRAADRYQWRGKMSKTDAYQAITQAKAFLLENYGTTYVPLGSFQRLRRGEEDLPLGGGPDVLAAMYSTRQPDGTYQGIAGESYIELVRFGPEGVEIESIHAYGSSEKPDSPHYTDQMEHFVRQELKTMSLDRETVLQQAKKVYAPRKIRRQN